jgi:hypothetical protein
LWCEILPVLARRPRKDLVIDLEGLASVIIAVGGPMAAVEVTCAIQDVGRWWP